MKVSTSILSVKENLKMSIDKLNNTNTDYIHLDIMDGIFVENKTWTVDDIKELLIDNTKPLDIHLMVSDVKKYINDFSTLKPKYITFHYEAVEDIDEIIDYIKNLGIKVGLAIKPSTDVKNIYPYLSKIDLVLVMSVNPGMGGQEFMFPSISKINDLKEYKTNNNLNYIINVDGGINGNTINLVKNADMVVSGSFITNNDYQESIDRLKQ